MRITISAKNMTVSEKLKERIDKKVGKLGRYFDDDTEAHVRLRQERGNRNIVEVTIPVSGDVLRGEVVSDDMYNSVDRVLLKLERQIHKNRTRLEKRLRADAFDSAILEYAFSNEFLHEDDTENAGKVVRIKKLMLRPMFVEDAIVQMDLLEHDFYLFLDAQTNRTCAVYRRKSGGYGLLEPQNV